jgi:geranylgeranyl pyrophosphate synthase
VLEIVHWVTSGSAVRGAVDLAKRYARRARATLSEFGASPMRQVLDELIDYVIERTR